MPPAERPPLIVITGIGLATSLGRDVEATWAAIRQGRVGFGPMEAMESALPEDATGGQAIDLPEDFEPQLPREARYLRWVISHALLNAGASRLHHKPERCATILGTTLHGLRAGGRFLRSDDPGTLNQFLASAVTRLAISGLGLEGLSLTTCSACSSSLGAIAIGATMLETGQADLVVAGGYDPVSEYAWAGFNALRLVASRAVMPFAKQRQGMMLGEGYAVLVLERGLDADRRGGRVVASIDGWGESADAHHLTQPDPQGTGAAKAIRSACDRAGVQPADISMIAAHATATQDNDAAEYAAFLSVFSHALPRIPVVGFKSYLGHTLGGAGAVELALSACALQAGWVPPCANVQQDGVEFANLTVAPVGGLTTRVTRTLNTSLGFGGANTCMILGVGNVADPAKPAPTTADARTAPEVWITGYGLLLPGITGSEMLLDRLASPHQQVVARGATVADEQLSQILNIRRMRRQSTCVKLSLAAVSLALRNARLAGDTQRLSDACALLASTHGSTGFCSEYYSQIVREGVLGANPVLFAEGVPNAAAAHVSANFGIRGSCQTIIGARTAGLDALSLAALRIRSGATDTVIVAAAEETHDSVERAYRHFNQSAHDAQSPGFFISPGAVALVVESSVAATARGAAPIARIGECAAASAAGPSADDEACRRQSDSPRRVLQQVAATHTVIGSGNRTWIDRAEALAARSLGNGSLHDSLHDRVGDLFAAGPLLSMAVAMAQGKLKFWTSLCTDFTGTATAVSMTMLAPRYSGEHAPPFNED